MKGIILAGGEGTRLRPLTLVANKHLLPVYDKPMIYYPLQTLADMGCDDILIISGGDNIGGFAELLGDYFKDSKLTYRVQTGNGGIADALLCAEGYVDYYFPVILGDNYFETAPWFNRKPTIFVKSVPDPERFGVYDGEKIIEKPKDSKVDSAVIGLYVYDEDVFDFIKTLKPSKRGELEITDVNNWYIKKGKMNVREYPDFWSDMGTFNSLMEVANYVKDRSSK